MSYKLKVTSCKLGVESQTANGKRQTASRFTFHVSRIGILLCALFLVACAPDVVKQNEAGNEHFTEGAYADAVTAYRQAQVAEPERAEPYYNAANAYNRQGQADGAFAQTQQALKTAEDPLAAQAWYNVGNAFFDAQQWEPAIAAYQESLRLNPEDREAKHNLELALQKLQEQQEQESEDEESGDEESGDEESGDEESGDEESGDEESGDEESGDEESGDEESGDEESGEQESGEQESGNEEDQEQGDEEQQQSSDSQEEQMMTEKQAMQLLQALLGDSETLQERLQESYGQPGPQPEEDW